MASYVKGEYALGLCDKCGLRYKHKELKTEFNNGSQTGFLVCPECWSTDHPQNFVNRVDTNDPQTIRNARPDTGEKQSRSSWGWNPMTGMDITISIGTVTFA
jgi:hypothetical protein